MANPYLDQPAHHTTYTPSNTDDAHSGTGTTSGTDTGHSNDTTTPSASGDGGGSGTGLPNLGDTGINADLGGGDHVTAGGNGVDVVVGADHAGILGSNGIATADLGSGDHVTLDNSGLTAELGSSDAHVPLTTLGDLGNVGDLVNPGDLGNMGNLLNLSGEPLLSADAGANGVNAAAGDTDAHVGLANVLGDTGTMGGLLGGTVSGGGGDQSLSPDTSAAISVNADVPTGDQSFSPDSTAAIAAHADVPTDLGAIPAVDTGTIDSLSPAIDVHASDTSGQDLLHVTGI